MKKILLSKNERGFTLIELLVVIAIIAVLASLSFVGLQSARRRGNDVGALGQMNAILAQAQICADSYNATTNTTLGIPAAGTAICSIAGSGKYPSLPTGWDYTIDSVTIDAVLYAQELIINDGAYTYVAKSTVTAPGGSTKYIACNEGGCHKLGF